MQQDKGNLDDEPSAEWHLGCEGYYMGVPVQHNPFNDSDLQRYLDWEAGWEYAWNSCGQSPFLC